MIFPKDIPIYGDKSFRGKCPKESAEQATFFNVLKRTHPDIHKVAIHIKNEGSRTHSQYKFDIAQGLCIGASDIIIPGSPSFVCELKRQDHTQSRISKDQISFLYQAQTMGSFVCLCLGYEASIKAISDWMCLVESE